MRTKPLKFRPLFFQISHTPLKRAITKAHFASVMALLVCTYAPAHKQCRSVQLRQCLCGGSAGHPALAFSTRADTSSVSPFLSDHRISVDTRVAIIAGDAWVKLNGYIVKSNRYSGLHRVRCGGRGLQLGWKVRSGLRHPSHCRADSGPSPVRTCARRAHCKTAACKLVTCRLLFAQLFGKLQWLFHTLNSAASGIASVDSVSNIIRYRIQSILWRTRSAIHGIALEQTVAGHIELPSSSHKGTAFIDTGLTASGNHNTVKCQ